DHVWVVHPEHTGRLVSLFSRIEDTFEYEEVYEGLLAENDVFGFDVYAENGFKMNCEEERFSDIDQNSKLFPDQMVQKLPYVSNFAGYGMDQIIVIGCNYREDVSGYESSVLKSMTVTLDLLENIRFQVHEVEGAFNYTLDALARAAEASDDMTGQHIRRVNEYSKIIAKKLGMDAEFVKEIYNTAQMHDVGKIYV
ncbi:HD-GYP domain-containing protein, partial [Aduncisulcus paluster]